MAAKRQWEVQAMTMWDGRGLPPVARARVERFASSPLRTSLLSVPAAYSVRSVGFEPVGEVLGCIVQQISFAGYGGAAWGTQYLPSQVITSANRYYGYGPLVNAMTNGWTTSIRRMREEAAALGADGVVGVSLTQSHLGEHAREFVAIGTAVRAQTQCPRPPTRPFTTELSGADFAKLLLSGWLPVSIAIGYEVATRADDYTTQQQTRSWSGQNVEVAGYTDLVSQARDRARAKFGQAVIATGAEGAVVSHLGVQLQISGEATHIAEATIRGTAITAFGRSRTQPAAPLTMIPTRSAKRAT
jgi:uncharacterized protein YbjQ (UPF0145 family)